MGIEGEGTKFTGSMKEEGVNRRKVNKKKKKRKLTFERKTAGGELKPGGSGHIGRKLYTGKMKV